MIQEAIDYAAKAHEGAVRKGSLIPYITHPLEAAVIVSLMTTDEELIAAALLHDVIEDAGKSGEELEAIFGHRVASLVMSESEDKSKSWLERKTATIEGLRVADRDQKILALGDKLSNIRSTAKDQMLLGDKIWERFHEKDMEKHGWYYWGVADALSEMKEYGEYQEFLKLCRLVFGDLR